MVVIPLGSAVLHLRGFPENGGHDLSFGQELSFAVEHDNSFDPFAVAVKTIEEVPRIGEIDRMVSSLMMALSIGSSDQLISVPFSITNRTFIRSIQRVEDPFAHSKESGGGDGGLI